MTIQFGGNEMEKELNTIQLQDELFTIQTALRKAQIVQWDITHNFLGELDEKKRHYRFLLEYETNHYKGLMLQDNLDVIEKQLAKIMGILEATDEASNTTTHEFVSQIV